MNNSAVPRLCGGTFFTLILQSQKNTGSKRERIQGKNAAFVNSDVLFTLLQIVQPDAAMPVGTSFDSYTTHYKNCKGSIGEDLAFDNANVVNAFNSRIKSEYVSVKEVMESFIVEYIDLRGTTQATVNLVKSIIEVIRDDDSIAELEKFCIGDTKIKKSELINITEVSLSDFLLSIWSFIVNSRKDNTVGRETILSWQDKKNKTRFAGNDGSTVTQDMLVSVPDTNIGNNEANPKVENEPAITQLNIVALPENSTSISGVITAEQSKAIKEQEINSRLKSALSGEQHGVCIRCSNWFKTTSKKGKLDLICEIVSAEDGTAFLLCPQCNYEVKDDPDEIIRLAKLKEDYNTEARLINHAQSFIGQEDIEKLMRELTTILDKAKSDGSILNGLIDVPLDECTTPNSPPAKVSDKISDPLLCSKVSGYGNYCYYNIQSIINRISNENTSNVDNIRPCFNQAYRNLKDDSYSQSRIFNALVEILKMKTGNKYSQESYEAVISYLVPQCSVFERLTRGVQ
jgi:hypothetical protein